jgi:biopolymer transport protein ExbB
MDAQIDSSTVLTDNPLGRVFNAAEQEKSANTENLELILDEAITREIPILEKGLPMIKLLAAVAPLLGLLGTVTGMIATFQSISLFGTGDPKLMASGISQALVTTMLGLCVAIPLLFLHSLVASRSRTLVQILDEQTAGLVNRRSEKT